MRNLVLGLAAGVLAFSIGLGLIVGINVEAAALDQRIAALDVQLIEKRAIARDPAAVRAELARIEPRLVETRRMFSPTLSAIRTRLGSLGVIEPCPRVESENGVAVMTFSLSIADPSKVEQALTALDGSGLLLTFDHVRVASGWSATMRAYEYPRLPEPRFLELPRHWYSPINSYRFSELAEKKREIGALDTIIEGAASFPKKKRELEVHLAVIEKLASKTTAYQPYEHLRLVTH